MKRIFLSALFPMSVVSIFALQEMKPFEVKWFER